jgi:hypothetical protein
MGCFAYQEKVSDYIDNLLPPPERQQMEEHMATCPACYAVYKDLELICEASRNLPQYEPSPVVWERILAELSPQGTGVWASAGSGWMARWFPVRAWRPGAWTWQPAWAAVFIFFIGIAAVVYYRSSAPPSEPIARNSSTNLRAGNSSAITVQPVNRLIIDKPLIEVELVQQRIEELQKRIETIQTGWSPEVRALYRRQLQMVDHCISNCQEKFAAHNDNPAVRAVYQAALRAKLEMLKQFSEL